MQFTPPGSPASIQFGENTNSMQPGSLEGLFLVVDDAGAVMVRNRRLRDLPAGRAAA